MNRLSGVRISRFSTQLGWLALLGALAIAACDTRPTFDDVATEWVSPEHGFSVIIHRSGRYTFCDREQCFSDRYERIGVRDSPAIRLKRVGSHPHAARFLSILEVFEQRDRVTPDLNFSVSGGLFPKQLCDGDPCVIFGRPQRGGHNMIFRRRQDL